MWNSGMELVPISLDWLLDLVKKSIWEWTLCPWLTGGDAGFWPANRPGMETE